MRLFDCPQHGILTVFPMHTHHLLYGVLTQYLSPGPCLDVVDLWSSSRPVVAYAIARVPFALFISVSCSGSVLTVSDCIWLYLAVSDCCICADDVTLVLRS